MSEAEGTTQLVEDPRLAQLMAENQALRETIEVYERTVAEQSERLDAVIRELRRSNADLDQFAYAASHDLRAPLRGLASLAHWLQDDLGEHLDERARGQFELMRRRIERMDALINGILEYSRIGRVAANVERVDTRQLLDEVRDLISPPPGFVVVTEGEFPVLDAERAPLQQVLANVLSNAVKHHDRGAGRIVVRAEELPEAWRFEVQDDGPGIAPEFHQQIFRMFTRLVSRDVVEGSGLGLAIARKVVEDQGGTIEVRSALGAGATFSFTWPKRPPARPF